MPEYEYDVPEYFQVARLPNVGRYRTLIRFLQQLFEDGVTEEELDRLISMKNDVLLEYYIALNVLNEMKESATSYMAARALVAHLHRCYVLMEYAFGKVRAYRAVADRISFADYMRRRQVGGEIFVKANGIGLTLLKSLQNQTERIKAAEPEIRERMGKMPRELIAYWEGKVMDGLRHLEKQPFEKISVNELNRILGLQMAIENERESA